MTQPARASGNWLLKSSLKRPILSGLALLVIALGFKFVDHFVLGLDELLGEIILSKSLGFLLVVAFVSLAGRSLKDIGLRREGLASSLAIGVGLTAAAFIIAYGIEFLLQTQRGGRPSFLLDAIDSKVGVSGGLLFGLWLVLGNLVNSFMEEGLFRGLMIRLFRARLTFWQTNWLQAALFGIWHLPWVLRYYQLGTIESSEEILFAAFANSVPQLLMGLVWGYMFLKTGNLWAPWAAHVVTNSMSNLLHIASLNGLDSGFFIRMSVYTVAMLLGMLLLRSLAENAGLREVKAWGDW